jgi:hypothetical protein
MRIRSGWNRSPARKAPSDVDAVAGHVVGEALEHVPNIGSNQRLVFHHEYLPLRHEASLTEVSRSSCASRLAIRRFGPTINATATPARTNMTSPPSGP